MTLFRLVLTGDGVDSHILPLLEVLIVPLFPTATKYSAPKATLVRSDKVSEYLLTKISVPTPGPTNIDPATPTATQVSTTLEYVT